MNQITHISLARVDELFDYKYSKFSLPAFPGYTNDQWGIKAHNRPWVEIAGNFSIEQRIIEVGGGYSLFPYYLSQKYQLEAWIGDDFGLANSEGIWSRWGDPRELPKKYPQVNYVFHRFGSFSDCYPNKYFDRIITISTLEHIPEKQRCAVIKDINRCLAPNGMQLHTIDIPYSSWVSILKQSLFDKVVDIVPSFYKAKAVRNGCSDIRKWIEIFRASGIKNSTDAPNPSQLLDRRILVESPDVVYRFYPPNEIPKSYRPSASLLIIIEDV